MSPTIAGGERGPGLLPNAESFVLPPGKRGPDVVIGLSVASFEKKRKKLFLHMVAIEIILEKCTDM